MGVPVCVAGPKWEFMVTSQFICSPRELAHGAPFWMFLPGKVPQGVPVVFRFKRATVTAHPGGAASRAAHPLASRPPSAAHHPRAA